MKYTISKQLFFSVLLVLIFACNKKTEEVPIKGNFSAEWTETGDSIKTYTAKSFLFNKAYKLTTLYCVPSLGSTRNITLYLTDTIAGTYNMGPSGSGNTFAILNGVNASTGSFQFNCISGTLIITEKYLGWFSGNFDMTCFSSTYGIQKVKGNFKYVSTY